MMAGRVAAGDGPGRMPGPRRPPEGRAGRSRREPLAARRAMTTSQGCIEGRLRSPVANRSKSLRRSGMRAGAPSPEVGVDHLSWSIRCNRSM